MMDGIILAALALLSVPVLLIVILVKVCGLENKVSYLTKRIGVNNLTQSRGVAGDNVSRRGAEAQSNLDLGAVPPALQPDFRVSASPRDNSSAPSTSEAKSSASTNEVQTPVAPAAPRTPYEPTAIDIFWMRVEDWIAVRGDFAPKGMTHEFAFATRWLVRVGVALIVGAIIYFVKLSIDRGWMGPTGRVAATLFWGAAFCVGGSWLVKKERYSLLGHAIAALGVVALYLGFGLGHRFFDPPVIASPVFAFCALAAVTFCAGVMAVYLRSPYIAVMGLVGGYLVPVIAGRDSGFPLWLDAYLLVLNLGAFYVARMRRWSALDFLASMLAFALCCIWGARHQEFGGRAAVLVNFAFLSAVHALYMTSVIVGSRTRGKVGNAIAWAGLSVNACCYFGWLAWVFRAGFADRATGLVLLALVAAYFAVAYLATKRGWADRATIGILVVFALAYLSIVPLLLFSRPWCVVSWAALAVATAEAESRSRQRLLGVVSFLLLAAAACVGLFYYAPLAYCERSVGALTSLSGGEYLAEFALRLVRLWTLPVAALLVARRLRAGALAVAALVAVFLFFTGEARNFGYVFLPALKSGTVSVAWLFAAFGGLWAGIVRRSRLSRICALSLLGVAVAKVLVIDTAHLTTPVRVALFALSGVLLIVGAFLYMKFRERFEA